MSIFTRPHPLTAFPTRRDEIDAFLSSEVELDLEDSFASNMSLHSPPRSRREHSLPSEDDPHDYAPMDISPAPPRVLSAISNVQVPKRDTGYSNLLTVPKLVSGRPRSKTGYASQRLFGKDLSNSDSSSSNGGHVFATTKVGGNARNTANEKSGKGLQRAALPVEWLQTRGDSDNHSAIRDKSSMFTAKVSLVVSRPHKYLRLT